MDPTAPSAEVSNIQLTEFIYNPEYDFANMEEVELKITVLHRAPLQNEQFDVLVKIVYQDKKTSESVLSTSCVTSYTLKGMKKGTDSESSTNTIDIPGVIDSLMKIEAVAHARALVAVQAASTPFGKTYVSLGTRVMTQLIQEEIKVLATK
ncbi:hypothetical protein [Hymenobacter nivis]|uniref:hypothetical protein n=1 Tax=Hymenobacter nivis TaxID=1850093 RepID=UPI0013A5727D|nr:hypothetical protein [Hymenobacter nivis]